MRIVPFVMVVVAASILGGSGRAAAQEATPAPFPVAPAPSECRVEPRSVESIIAVVATPTAAEASDAASATPFVPPAGQPADAATAAAAAATIREVFACANAGDFLRVYALFTDDYLRAFLAGTPLTEEVIAFFAATPTPLPDEQRRIIVRMGEARLLPDGRVGVVTVLDEPDDPRTEEPDYVILAQVGGRWLVDAVIEDGGTTVGTPEP